MSTNSLACKTGVRLARPEGAEHRALASQQRKFRPKLTLLESNQGIPMLTRTDPAATSPAAPTGQLDHQRLASEVLRACVLGDAPAVRELLHQSAPVVLPALFGAIQGGHAEVVELLAASPDVDVNRCLANGCSPLFKAASLGHTDCAARLLDAQAAVDTPASGSSPLLVAAAQGHAAVRLTGPFLTLARTRTRAPTRAPTHTSLENLTFIHVFTHVLTLALTRPSSCCLRTAPPPTAPPLTVPRRSSPRAHPAPPTERLARKARPAGPRVAARCRLRAARSRGCCCARARASASRTAR